MTIRKQYPARGYDTFPDDDNTVAESPTSLQGGGDADKSRSAAAEARRLASQGSWAESFGGTPATNRTPVASTVDGNEERDIPYRTVDHDDPSDPPPVYTPSVSTQVASQSPAPASPAAARAVPVPASEPVSAPNTQSSSLHANPSQSSPQHDEEAGPSSLPEAINRQQEADDEDETDSDNLPVFLRQQHKQHKQHRQHRQHQQHQQHQHKKDRCRKGSWNGRSCGGQQHRFGHLFHHKRDRRHAHRIKKICFFLLALIACLCFLIPGLVKSLKNVQEPFPTLALSRLMFC